jgi:hypothetical protein
MGAWGHGHFEDDSALDFMGDVEESSNPKKIIDGAFDTALSAEYIDADDGNAVIVAATYIDRQLNGTKFSYDDQREPLDVDTFPERHPDIDFSDLKKKSVLALKRILTEDSELNELWRENEEDYPSWRQGVEQLIHRLEK